MKHPLAGFPMTFLKNKPQNVMLAPKAYSMQFASVMVLETTIKYSLGFGFREFSQSRA